MINNIDNRNNDKNIDNNNKGINSNGIKNDN